MEINSAGWRRKGGTRLDCNETWRSLVMYHCSAGPTRTAPNLRSLTFSEKLSSLSSPLSPPPSCLPRAWSELLSDCSDHSQPAQLPVLPGRIKSDNGFSVVYARLAKQRISIQLCCHYSLSTKQQTLHSRPDHQIACWGH